MMKRLSAIILAIALTIMPFAAAVGGVASANSDTARQMIFDDRDTFELDNDFVMGGGYWPEYVSLSTEVDHTTGAGKSLKMGKRTALYHRVKLEHMFSDADLGRTFTVSAWVYSKDEAASGVSVGVYGATGTAYATTPAAYTAEYVQPNTWTELVMEYEHTDRTVTQLGFDQKNGAVAPTLFVDDITITPVAEEGLGELLPFETRVVREGSRPIPIVANTGKSYDDLIFYDRAFEDEPDTETKDPDTLFQALPPGRVIKNQDDLISANVTGPEFGRLETVPITGMPFDTAWQATVSTVPENPWDYQLVLDNMNEGVDFAAGDKMLLVFYMRTLETSREDGSGMVQTIVEMDVHPNSKALAENVISLAGQGWHKVYLPFTAKSGYPRLCIRLGYHLQTVEFGGYELINYEDQVAFDELPSSSVMVTTDGRGVFNKDEAWRIDAWDRIEQIRKGDIHVIVHDSKGNPVEGAQVDVNMVEHEFKWGTAINASMQGNSRGNERYRAAVAALFNSAVLESEHKWVPYETDPQKSMDLVNGAVSLGLKSVRGHTLIWDRSFPNGWTPNTSIPQDLAEMLAQDDREGVEDRIKDHFASILQSSPQVVDEWDVLNETLSNKAMRDKYGNIIIKDWFQWAREYAPQAELYINETGIIGLNPSRVDKFKDVLDSMVANQVDFDGIGIQGHVGDNYTDMEDVYADMMEFAAYGKDMKITEFDMGLEISQDREYESSFTRDMMIMSFSIENMTGFFMWGFNSGIHWLSNAPVLNSDWTLKASGEQYLDLVYNKWWTDESGVTGADGTFGTRGFYGDYDVTVTVNGKAKTVESQVYNGQNNIIEIVLEDALGPVLSESGGGLGTAYVEWAPVSNAQGYNVYVKPASAADSEYDQLDAQAISEYPTHWRADAAGLAAGNYVLKVEAVLPDGLKASAVSDTITVLGNGGSTGSGMGFPVVPSSPIITIEENPSGVSIIFHGKDTGVVSVNKETLAQAIESLLGTSGSKLEIEIKADEPVIRAELPAALLAEAAKQIKAAVVSVKYGNTSYDLPVSALDFTKLAQTLNTTLQDLTIAIQMEQISGQAADQLASGTERLGARQLGSPIKTKVLAEGGGAAISVDDFGGVYILHSIEVPAGIDSRRATGVLFDPATGEFTYVPTVFEQVGGAAAAIIKHSGNGIYVIIEHNKSFADMNGHWAKTDVELLASKLLINGRAEGQFAPQGEVTRAEFAAMLVRGLGISPAPSAAAFQDVDAADWYAGYVGAAAKAGLVEGTQAGIFAPNSNITREQMAVMISRAMQAAGKPQAGKSKNLVDFTDEGLMSNWAKEAISQSVGAGLMNGKDSQLFAPSFNATRAEAAVVLKRLLQYAELMN